MIEALTFDADQTLWDFHEVQQRALRAVLEAMARQGEIRPGNYGPSDLQQARDRVVISYRGRPHQLERVRAESFALFLTERGQSEAEAKARSTSLLDLFLDIRFNQIRLYPEVASVLHHLARSYKMGLVSNGNTYPERCGLPGVFDAVVLGPDYGFEKPDKRAFEMIASKLEVPLHKIVHIGDDKGDVCGANAAGAASVYLNRTGANPEFRSAAAHEAQDLNQLTSILDSLN
jgi:putative hydrolase of the HAD superfamily